MVVVCHGIHVACVCVCHSGIILLLQNLIHTSFTRRKQGMIGFYGGFVVWLLLKMLYSKVLASFADHCCFSHSASAGVCLDGGPAPLIITPFMENGSLLSYLRNNRCTLLPTEDNETSKNLLLIAIL